MIFHENRLPAVVIGALWVNDIKIYIPANTHVATSNKDNIFFMELFFDNLNFIEDNLF